MKPDEMIALRKELRCTPRELAEALGVGAEVVMAWEEEEEFPTKQFIDRMNELRARGPTAIVRRRGRAKDGKPPLELLADPEIWAVVRKLLAHAELRRQVQELADRFEDPAGPRRATARCSPRAPRSAQGPTAELQQRVDRGC